jgi:hypothetical protein
MKEGATEAPTPISADTCCWRTQRGRSLNVLA